MRASGVLLPISSLPSAYGIGSFSKEAYEFVVSIQKQEDRNTGRFCLWVLQDTETHHISLFLLMPESLLYRSGNTDRGWSFDKRGM